MERIDNVRSFVELVPDKHREGNGAAHTTKTFCLYANLLLVLQNKHDVVVALKMIRKVQNDTTDFINATWKTFQEFHSLQTIN